MKKYVNKNTQKISWQVSFDAKICKKLKSNKSFLRAEPSKTSLKSAAGYNSDMGWIGSAA